MGKSLTDFIIPAALGATGFGLAGMGPLAALGGAGAGAAEAGSLGAGLLGSDAAALGAGEALGAANGAFGTAGMAQAQAMAAGMPSLIGEAGVSQLPLGQAAFGPNGEYMGADITADGLTHNAFTGGYDGMGMIGRAGQQLGSAFDGMSMGDQLGMANKAMGMMNPQQPQQAPKNVISNVQAPPQPQSPQSPSSFTSASNIQAPNFGVQGQLQQQQAEEEQKRRMFQSQYGYTPFYRG
ncbi:MAG: hypothetical protein WC733_02135 [Methylophilus sp.]|jgi:hypothetical protein